MYIVLSYDFFDDYFDLFLLIYILTYLMISLLVKYILFFVFDHINSICIAATKKQNKVNPNGYNRFLANGNLSSEGNMVNGKPKVTGHISKMEM
ncbi:MAG: hypothetical protein IPP29_02985 [Bacteroidetes bacterium]|nr:hypothetical protein [Bacteroidota bacterium]